MVANGRATSRTWFVICILGKEKLMFVGGPRRRKFLMIAFATNDQCVIFYRFTFYKITVLQLVSVDVFLV